MSQLSLHRLFATGMVLQRDKALKVWGQAGANESIRLEFLGHIQLTKTGNDGCWQISMGPLTAGGPYVLRVESSSGQEIVLRDVLVGDVWLCSGQSNMVLPIDRVRDRYAKEMATASNTRIRRFLVPDRYDFDGCRSNLEDGVWEPASNENLGQFSALAWFFADELFRSYQIPIGLICAAVGGAPIEAFMSQASLAAWPSLLEPVLACRVPGFIQSIQSADEKRIGAWHEDLWDRDAGNGKAGPAWFDSNLSVEDWGQLDLPAFCDETAIGSMHGAVWLRKEIELTGDQAAQTARLDLGTLVDEDQAWVNGVLVGSTGYQYPPRRYVVPVGVLRPGRNVIAIRLVCSSGRGGFIKDKPCVLRLNNELVNLAGVWRFRIGGQASPLESQTFFQYRPTGLFNAMINPLFGFVITGVVWYQGESNTGTVRELPPYHELLARMIGVWREGFDDQALPFLVVQLANFGPAQLLPQESTWAELRNEQARVLELPGTGLAVAIDLGEWNDLHPENKKDLARRLALLAGKMAYGEKDLVCHGPVCKAVLWTDKQVELEFDGLGGGLQGNEDGTVGHFALAAADGTFGWAHATIKGNRVVVWHDAISHPQALRYAWADNPVGANLRNRQGLPAQPFMLLAK